MYYIEMLDHDTLFTSILSVKNRTEWKAPPIKHLEEAKAKFPNKICKIKGDHDKVHCIWICHSTFGIEGFRDYYGSNLGALRAVRKMSRKAGRGWRGVIASNP